MVATHIFDAPPPGVASDWTMPQDWGAFTADQHATWTRLFERQSKALEGYASRAFLRGLDILKLERPGIPDLCELNARLSPTTGWQVVAVPGWIPNRPFFEHLANRRFPAANFLRLAANIAYSEEPDMFHDLFGHVPTLTDPQFSDFLVAYGEAGLRAEQLGASDYLGRLWLYTVEFGLVIEDGGLRAFGGGLLSSYAETISALTSPDVRRLRFEIERVMRTKYNFDAFQRVYFVIDSFEHLLHAAEEADFAAIYRKIADQAPLEPDGDCPGDRIYDGPLAKPQATPPGGSEMIRRRGDDGVDFFEVEIDGEKIQWDEGLTYARHIQTERLLSSQIPVSDKPDELLFIIMHQTMELWLKLMLHETRLAVEALREDRVEAAGKTLERIATIQRHMIHSWEVLATLTPHDYLTFRGFLRRASGFQSHQYRELEYRLGNKREDMMVFHQEDPAVLERLRAAFEAPSLYDELLRLLARRGLSVPPEYIDRDWTQPHIASDAIEDVWLHIYSNVEDYWDLYTLAEKVTALEYYFQEWRFKHMKTVARVIGHKPGTAGSSGVNYLVKALNLGFFPELWSMRTRMMAPREGGNYADAPATSRT
jgi:tryptophan 2,3-dioxygenase